MSGEEAAAALECGQAKISRIETGVNGVRPFELRGLLKVYGVTDPELAEVLVEMAKEGNRRSWWNLYGEVLPGLSDLMDVVLVDNVAANAFLGSSPGCVGRCAC
jgi:hypothetical protein